MNQQHERAKAGRRAGIVGIRGEGLPLVLIHGNAVDHRLLVALDHRLDGFERHDVDVPGFGRTPAPAGAGGLPELAIARVSRRPAARTGGRKHPDHEGTN